MVTSRAFLAAFLVSAFAMGCKSASPILGTWTMSPGGGKMTITFNDNDTMAITTDGPGGIHITASGAYVFKNKTLTLTPQNVQLQAPAAIKARLGPLVKQEEGKPQTVSVAFKDKDSMTWTNNGSSQTLTRVQQ